MVFSKVGALASGKTPKGGERVPNGPDSPTVQAMGRRALTFLEFFAGGGMARLGLGARWDCRFANDLDPLKARTYRANFGAGDLVEGDVWELAAANLPSADLAWASSPCQDLSLAGPRDGLGGRRSSAYWGFHRLIAGLAAEGRAPKVLVIENVVGLFTSHGGADFTALCRSLAELGYRFGALELDAAAWLPQSRPRAFVVATSLTPPASGAEPSSPRVRAAADRLPTDLKARWIGWNLLPPSRRNAGLADLLEPDAAVPWFDPARTDKLLGLMNPLHRRRLQAAAAHGRAVGALYRRVRMEPGGKAQRAEVRFDGLAGCLRTPAGGSSRQVLLVADHGKVRARHLTGREGARLMGLPEDYALPPAATAALKVLGDGVAVPVVRALAEQILEPLLDGAERAAA